jgi:hypothetical protein
VRDRSRVDDDDVIENIAPTGTDHSFNNPTAGHDMHFPIDRAQRTKKELKERCRLARVRRSCVATSFCCLVTRRAILIGSAVFTAIVASSAFSANTPSDVELRRLLIGDWVIARDSPNKTDAWAIAHNFLVVERYAADGTGHVLMYTGTMCSVPDSPRTFSWSVVGGMIVSKRGAKVIHDRVISLDAHKLVMFSIEHRTAEIRNRTVPCPVS